MKAFGTATLENWFQSLQNQYDVRLPIKLHDGTRTLGRIGEGELALIGGPLPMPPTTPFFPYLDLVLTFENNQIKLPTKTKPIMLIGLTAQDANCLEFIDRFYGTNYYDQIYFNKRQNSAVVCITGQCGTKGEFLKISGKNCDLELIATGDYFAAVPYSNLGTKLIATLTPDREVNLSEYEQLKEKSNRLPTDEDELIATASKLIKEDRVPDSFWREIANRCIACTACTLACPTCTCFDVYDRHEATTLDNAKQTSRMRIKDSCQLAGFMREASGHNPMAEEHTRTRRRIHHKLVADLKRWGHFTCFLCGRCDKVCPTKIGIKNVCRELVAKFGSS